VIVISVLAGIAAAANVVASVAQKSVVGGLLGVIATAWTIAAATSGMTFVPALAFGVIGLVFVALGTTLWTLLEDED
jgi:hypothetical protein